MFHTALVSLNNTTNVSHCISFFKYDRFLTSGKRLPIAREKNCVILNSIQEFIEIEAWLLLTIFIRLHNQLSYLHSSTIKYLEAPTPVP